ncbi:MAG: 3-dehydroquinate synthase [Pirellulales bacterium]
MNPASDDRSIDVSFSVPQSHRVRFTRDVLADEQDVLLAAIEPSGDAPPRVQFWVDENVLSAMPLLRERIRRFADRHRRRIRCVGSLQVVPGGEDVKNDIHILERMLKVMNAAELDRRSYVVVIGGGAVLDAVGFAAAIAHRGIRLVRLPTTTLAQGDSAIGVKNGVNLFGKKNWVGSFAVPWAVINDEALLSTLSDRDFVAGFSEAVKVSLLKDPALFELLCAEATEVRRRKRDVAMPIIRRSAMLHLDHITRGGDPFEALEARPLDFGHWSAHKLEAMTDFELRHGEAVAIGVAIDTVYSSLALGLAEETAERVLRCLGDLGFAFDYPVLDRRDALFGGLEEFRQHLGGRLTLTMLRGVGDPIEVHEVDHDLMRQAIDYVATYARSPGEFALPLA